MNTIWKFPIDITDESSITMPMGAKVLSVQTQNGQPCIWAEVNTRSRPEERPFRIFGTGHELPDGLHDSWVFVGTFQVAGGALVFHLYRKIMAWELD